MTFYIGSYIQGLIVTFLAFSLAMWLFKKILSEKKAIGVSILITAVITITVGAINTGVERAVAIYLPCALFWGIVRLARSK
jgi:hypothetical protein